MYERKHPWRDYRDYETTVPPVVFASPTPRDPKAVKLSQARDKAYDELGKAVVNLLRATLAEDHYRAVTMAKAYGRPEPLPEYKEMLAACKAVAGELLPILGLLAESQLHAAIGGLLFPPQTLCDDKDRECKVMDLEPPATRATGVWGEKRGTAKSVGKRRASKAGKSLT